MTTVPRCRRARPRAAWARFLKGAGLAAAIAQAAGGPAGAVESCRTFPARMLADSVGVNTHMQQGWQYDDGPSTLAALRDLGIDQLREAFTGLGHPGIEAAARAGFKFDFIINAGWGTGAADALAAWERRFPGSILAVEGPNEVNNTPVTYEGRTGTGAAKAFQSDLYDRVHGEAALAGIPVVALTSWPVFRNRSDLGNVHAYARSGGFASEDIRKAVDDERLRNPPPKSIWMTEVGYHSGAGFGRDDEGVSESAQAKMLLAVLLTAPRYGIAKTFLYQLEDQFTDASDEQSHFGLVDRAWRRKPAFTAVANLLTILRRKGRDVEARGASFTLEGLPADARQLEIEDDDGGLLLALWGEAPIWDARAHAPIPARDRHVTLIASRDLERVDVFDPMLGSEPVRSVDRARSIDLPLADHPILVALHARADQEGCLQRGTP